MNYWMLTSTYQAGWGGVGVGAAYKQALIVKVLLEANICVPLVPTLTAHVLLLAHGFTTAFVVHEQ